jgi:hypothetical protein
MSEEKRIILSFGHDDKLKFYCKKTREYVANNPAARPLLCDKQP